MLRQSEYLERFRFAALLSTLELTVSVSFTGVHVDRLVSADSIGIRCYESVTSPPVAGTARIYRASGTSIQNVLPTDGWLTTPILPLCDSTIDLQIVNPSPVPSSFAFDFDD